MNKNNKVVKIIIKMVKMSNLVIINNNKKMMNKKIKRAKKPNKAKIKMEKREMTLSKKIVNRVKIQLMISRRVKLIFFL